MVPLPIAYLAEAADRFAERRVVSRFARKHLSHDERLAEEPLDPPCPRDDLLVVLAEFVDAENRDDILKVAVALENLLHASGGVVMLLPDDLRVQNSRRARQRINRRVDALFHNRAFQHNERVEVGNRRSRRRVRHVISRHVDGLDGRNRTVTGRGNPLLKRAHLRSERGLVSHGRGHAAQQRRDLAAGLGETENIVDKQQRLGALVAEVLRNRQRRQRHAKTRPRRLVHLPEDQRRLLEQLLAGIADIHLLHFQPHVIAFARPLANSGEHAVPTVASGDSGDELLDNKGLAEARPAEQTRLAAANKWRQKVDHLYAGLENLALGNQRIEGWNVRVDGPIFLSLDGSASIDRLAENVEYSTEGIRTNGHFHGLARVHRGHAALHTVSRPQGHAPHPPPAKVLLDLAGDHNLFAIHHANGVEDLRKRIFLELGVECRSNDLNYSASSGHFIFREEGK